MLFILEEERNFSSTLAWSSDELRYGVAFSLERGRNLPSIEPLLPKLSRFNEFLRLYPDRYADLRMWHWQETRSTDYPAGPIPEELAVPHTFIFLGKRQPIASPDYDDILAVFDRLLPLYEYTEGGNGAQPVDVQKNVKFEFHPGCSVRSNWTTASITKRQLDVTLRHNTIQVELHRRLSARYGEKNVGAENSNAAGGIMDVVVRTSDGLWIYEIKTSSSARGCIREAVGQLLEYSLWPGAPKASKLVVVGEGPLDRNAKEYLRRLNEQFPLPISYEQISIST